MNFLKGKKLPIGHFFLALAAGLMLFLLPTEAKVQCEQQFWLLYVLSVSVTITGIITFYSACCYIENHTYNH